MDHILTTLLAEADDKKLIDWDVSVDATICRAHQHAVNTTCPEQHSPGLDRIARNCPCLTPNLLDMGLVVHTGGLTTKIHTVVDGLGRPLACFVTGGQRHDCPVLMDVLGEIRVPRVGAGRPRTTPDAVLAERAYSSIATRELLKARGVEAVIPARCNVQGGVGCF